jgi:CPA2 family monovalent cation:H+ antiporter-2
MLAASGGEAADSFVQLGVLVVLLAVLGRCALRFRMSPIPLYLLLGLVVGVSGADASTVTEDFVDLAADIGVLLLLFMLGLEFTPRELSGELRRHSRSGVVDLVLNAAPGVVLGLVLGWPAVACVVLGGVTYISSSGVVSKLIEDLGRRGNRETSLVLGILVLEDLAMIVFLPVLGVLLSGLGLAAGIVDVAVAAVIVAVVVLVAHRYGERLSRILWSGSDEVLLLSILGLVLVVAGVVEQADVSAAVGAFLVGVGLSGPVQQRAAELVGPLRDLFAALFFFLFALEIDLASVPPVLLPAAVLAAVGVVTKLLTGEIAGRWAGRGAPGRWRAGTALVARGEFSVVIAGLGVAAGVEPDLAPLTAAYVLIVTTTASVLVRWDRPPAWWPGARPAPSTAVR